MKNLENYTWPAEKLSNASQNKTKIISKIEKQTIKQTRQNKAKYGPFKYTYFKNMFKTNFCFWNRSSIKSARPEKIHWPLKID